MIKSLTEYKEAKDTYEKLCKIVVKSFSDPEADEEIRQGLLVALIKIHVELKNFAETKNKKSEILSYISWKVNEMEKPIKTRTSLTKKLFGKVQKPVVLKCDQCKKEMKFYFKNVQFETLTDRWSKQQNLVIILQDQLKHKREFSLQLSLTTTRPLAHKFPYG